MLFDLLEHYFICQIVMKIFWFLLHTILYFRLRRYFLSSVMPAGNYMFKVDNRNTTTRFEICSKLTIKKCCTDSLTIT